MLRRNARARAKSPEPSTTPRRRTRLRAAGVVIGLAVLASPLAFFGLASTDDATDRAKAIVPLPPKPYLQPTPLRTQPGVHEGADVCQQDGALCPDLAMRPPYQMIPDVERKRRVLRVANAVLSIGAGPVEVRGTRTSSLTMKAVQYVRRENGRTSIRVPGDAGRLLYKAIPGQGRIWKFEYTAQFELWSTGAKPKRVRVGPKLVYCLRDLRKLWDWERSPTREVYPACPRSSKIKKATLGTSAGWADIYPASYYEQWIDVQGLKGCFDLIHIADPRNRLVESDETNNASRTRIKLPTGRTKVEYC
ncbi:MAG: hypothetical protein JHD16_08210, partial [Solirubrobacteraceae bacterium]|nr:hypothetical protein [Solirubrobacteraceae bacterium]